jgi:hypothetical protein
VVWCRAGCAWFDHQCNFHLEDESEGSSSEVDPSRKRSLKASCDHTVRRNVIMSQEVDASVRVGNANSCDMQGQPLPAFIHQLFTTCTLLMTLSMLTHVYIGFTLCFRVRLLPHLPLNRSVAATSAHARLTNCYQSLQRSSKMQARCQGVSDGEGACFSSYGHTESASPGTEAHDHDHQALKKCM